MMPDDLLLSLLMQSFTGDKLAYEELLKWLEKHCLSQLGKVLKNYANFPKELRGDITQEVLITFHQTHQTFDTNRPLLPWINAIIRNKAIDFLRRKDFRVQMSGVDIELIKETLSENFLHDPVELNELMKLVNLLPTKQAKIIKLSKIEGFTTSEIANQLKMSESNVKVSIHRASKYLQKLFSGQNK